MISTRGRYAIRVMVDLAENSNGNYIPMKDVAKRQGISLKYLERILPVLAKNNYIHGIQGKGGGYKLTKKPEEYRIGDILRLTEGDLAPVACLHGSENTCERADKCPTIKMWSKYYELTNDYFDAITLADLMK
ncbi:MAG: RrF2 family transcriptional regulator [Acutalibacteraceae bacterium]